MLDNIKHLDKMPIPVGILNKSDEIIYTNQQFTKLFGFELGEINSPGLWLHRFFPDEKYRNETINVWLKNLNSKIETNNTSLSDTFNITCKNGVVKQIEVKSQNENEHILIYFYDVSPYVNSTKSLQRINDFGEQVLDHLPGIFYLFKHEENLYRLKRWNKNSESITGYSASELFNKEPDSFFLPGESALVYSILNSIEFSGSKEVELNLLLKNGTLTPFIFSLQVLTSANDKYVVGTATDISKPKDVEKRLYENELKLRKSNDEFLALNEELTQSYEELKATNEALQLARLKSQESEALKTAFLQNMSHEIRTPLNGILGFTSLLNDPKCTDEQRIYYSKIINESSNQLLGIVEDIISISKIETGQSEVLKNIVSPTNIIHDLIALFSEKAKEKNIELVAETNSTARDFMLITDEGKLWQILNNLISNAIKFSISGSVRIGYCTEYSKVKFWVKDNGIGIARENHHKIFERFRQIDLDLSRNYGGTGLGLTIAKANAELLGGNIWVESEPGKGSEFYFYIAFNSIGAGKELPITEKTGIHSLESKLLHILIAEDEEINFLLLEEMLQELDATIYRAENGREAIELIEKVPQINLILMDIKMPEMNGFEALKIIHEKRPGITVIAQTAYAYISDKQKILDAGFAAYISKPMRKSELVDLLNRFIPHINL